MRSDSAIKGNHLHGNLDIKQQVRERTVNFVCVTELGKAAASRGGHAKDKGGRGKSRGEGALSQEQGLFDYWARRHEGGGTNSPP